MEGKLDKSLDDSGGPGSGDTSMFRIPGARGPSTSRPTAAGPGARTDPRSGATTLAAPPRLKPGGIAGPTGQTNGTIDEGKARKLMQQLKDGVGPGGVKSPGARPIP